MSLRLLVLASAAATLMSVGTAALAADYEIVVKASPAAGIEVRSQRVSFADLNLGSSAGARALLGRIRNAARNVCGPTPTHLESTTDYDHCVDAAMSRAVGDLGSPLVTVAYQHGRGAG